MILPGVLSDGALGIGLASSLHHSNAPFENGRAQSFELRPARKTKSLQIRVARREHRGEPRDFFLATALLTRLFKMPMAAHDFERALAVNFFLQPPQRTIHRFAFF
jgi:hypothetical protein